MCRIDPSKSVRNGGPGDAVRQGAPLGLIHGGLGNDVGIRGDPTSSHAVDHHQGLVLVRLADVGGVEAEDDASGVAPDSVGSARPARCIQQALCLRSVEREDGQATPLEQRVGRIGGEQRGVADG